MEVKERDKSGGLTAAPIPRLIKLIAIPASVGFLFNTLFNVVDTYFAGFISTEAIAALSLSFPVFFIIIALGSGISTGATALMANALGAGDIKSARFYSSQAIGFGFLISFFLTWLGLAFSPALFRLLGAGDLYLSLALSYSNVIFYGSIFFLLNFILSAILTAQGDTKTYRDLLIIGFFLNLVFDPWFIYGGLGLPALGLPGVAWATIFIQFLTMLVLFYKISQSHFFCQDCFSMLAPRLNYYRAIAAQGFPASLNMLTIAIGVFTITYFVSRYGHLSVAAYGIATRIDQLAILPAIGLGTAALVLVGQNNGAGLFSRVKEVVKKSLLYGFYVVMFGMVIVWLFARQLMGFFSADQAVVSIGAGYLRISAPIYFAYIILFIAVSALQGLKRPLYAIWIGLYRQILAPLCFFWLLTKALDWRLNGIWWAIFISTWSAAVITVIYLRSVLKKYEPG